MGASCVYEVIDGNFPIGIYRRDRQLNTTDLVNDGRLRIGPSTRDVVRREIRCHPDPRPARSCRHEYLLPLRRRSRTCTYETCRPERLARDPGLRHGRLRWVRRRRRSRAMGASSRSEAAVRTSARRITTRSTTSTCATADQVTSLESRARPGYMRYVRPRGATPFRVSLVPSAEPCTSPNTTHGAPLSFPSCSPPARASSLNLGVGDGSPALARSIGSVLLKAVGCPSFPVDDADININFSLTNVMRAADLSDYTGELQGRVAIRITDKKTGPSAGEEGTVSDFDLAFTVLRCDGLTYRGDRHAQHYRKRGLPGIRPKEGDRLRPGSGEGLRRRSRRGRRHDRRQLPAGRPGRLRPVAARIAAPRRSYYPSPWQ